MKGSKIHAVVTTDSLPVTIAIGPANEHDSRKLFPLMEGISIRTGARPRKRPKEVYGDKGYDTPLVRFYLAAKHVKAQIPRRSKRKHPGRPSSFDRDGYKKRRSSVERFFGWVKGGFRRLEVRHERLASIFLGLTQIASIIIHWRVFG